MAELTEFVELFLTGLLFSALAEAPYEVVVLPPEQDEDKEWRRRATEAGWRFHSYVWGDPE